MLLLVHPDTKRCTTLDNIVGNFVHHGVTLGGLVVGSFGGTFAAEVTDLAERTFNGGRRDCCLPQTWRVEGGA